MSDEERKKIYCESCCKFLGYKVRGSFKVKDGTVQSGISKKDKNLIASYCSDKCLSYQSLLPKEECSE